MYKSYERNNKNDNAKMRLECEDQLLKIERIYTCFIKYFF